MVARSCCPWFQNGCDFFLKQANQLGIVAEVSVNNVQHSDFVRIAIEVGSDILGMDRFHDKDDIRPIDELLS